MIYLQLFYEFAKIGLFNFGGGMASLPFLHDLSEKTGWFTLRQLTDFIAISESTPGPMAVNVATYAGYTTGGLLGGCIATLGVIFPALILVSIMAKFLHIFRGNKYVDWAFYGLRPCVLALIVSALLSLFRVTLINTSPVAGNILSYINFRAIVIFAAIYILLNTKKLKKMHTVFFLAVSAVMGIILY